MWYIIGREILSEMIICANKIEERAREGKDLIRGQKEF